MSEVNSYPGDGMGGEVKTEEKRWIEEFMESWLELYRYHEIYPWVEGKDIAEQFYLLGRKDEQKVRQEEIDKYEIKIMQWIERCNTAEEGVKELDGGGRMSKIGEAVERFMEEGGWDKPKEIEEIKKRYPNECHCQKDEPIKSYPILGCPIHGLQVYRDIQTLLFALGILKEEMKGMVKFVERDITKIGSTSTY